MKTRLILLLIGILIGGMFSSCNILLFRTIDCRDFEFQDELKWYAGTMGNVLTLTNEANETKEYAIEDKYIYHRTKYISDTGCNCWDIWGILLSAENDTISMYGGSYYFESDPADRYDRFYIRHNDKVSRFSSGERSIVTNYSVNNIVFPQVLVFEYAYTQDNQIKKVVIAPETGIIELTETNGNIWRNTDLETKLKTSIDSFDYSENVCE